ncbi:MAG: hypothetical protein JNM99_19840 [Verrucomicrobiaceae bacterium]|nr:hypothetical protein [Verrucomicrobiaceae bacterium]
MNPARFTRFVSTLFLVLAGIASAAQITLTGPAGSGQFGKRTLILSNGNIVVTDPLFDNGATADVGAVYLFKPDGTLLSTIKGASTNDQVGGGSIFQLKNGNFVIATSTWDNGAVSDAGAVTWVNGTTGATVTGINATVSVANSLVGSKTGDFSGAAVQDVGNGNYIVRALLWDNGAASDTGMVLWSPGTTGQVGVVSSSNALVGSTASDFVGNTVDILANGNYVVRTPFWNNGAITDAGAVTFCDGNTGRVGAVGPSNSLVGSKASDNIGQNILELSNGNFVVQSSSWDNGATTNVGALTWGSGTAGLPVGPITSSNSLIGASGADVVGNALVLTNGNYVALTANWKNGATSVGAVTWCDGSTGRTGVVGTGNSLIGSTANDGVGNSAVALTNGNYVVASPSWDNGATANVGAATWCSGFGPTTGTVSAANSLIGSTAGDTVGNNTPVALKNGHYVVISSGWQNGANDGAGAATWGNGVTGTTGVVSPANSLVGTQSDDTVGASVLALSNGNYVALSTQWDNGTATQAGAATLCSGTGPSPVGAVSAANSLVGTTSGDQVGSTSAEVGNSNYVIGSISWDNGALSNAGMIAWGNGVTGIVGPVSAANALVGTNANENVGVGVGLLTNGNYLVPLPNWSSPVSAAVGAVTFGLGNGGVTGPVSSLNSMVGNATNDRVGSTGALALPNGNYIVTGPDFDNGGSASNAGVLAFGNGTTGTVGALSSAKALVGSTANDKVGSIGIDGSIETFTDGSVLVISRKWDNGSTVDAGAVTFIPAGTSLTGGINATNSFLGTVASGGNNLSAAYSLERQLLVVGKGSENTVILQGKSAGKVAFATAMTDALESAGTVNVKVNRVGGTEGTLTVNVSTSSVGGTATAGSDYTAITNRVLTFGPGVASLDVPVTILTDAVAEGNETFKLVLTPATAVVSPSSTIVRIISLGDLVSPSAPVIASPAANARVPANPGDKITISGTAADNNGVLSVQVRVNGGLFTNATMTNHTGKTASWSIQLAPQTGANSIDVRTIDTDSNIGPLTTRNIVCTRPLVVKGLGGFPTFTAGFAGRTFRESGKLLTVTATPSAGFLFKNWTVSGGPNASLSNIGLTAAQLELPTLSFVFKESLTLTANFAANPFLSTAVSGVYSGNVFPSSSEPDRVPLGSNSGEDGTARSNSTTGGITVTVLSNATFTGKLTMDGLTLSFAGSLDSDGIARFGATRERALFLPRTGKTPLKLVLGVSPFFQQLFGTVSDVDAVSGINAKHANYSATNPVPSTFLTASGGSQVYNLAFTVFPGAQPSGVTSDRFPQGSGVGSFTLTKTGGITLAGVLADGTAVTASGPLDVFDTLPIYCSLYNNRGFITGNVVVDPTQLDTDAACFQLDWVRPILDDQYYPAGWPGGIQCRMKATRFTVLPGSSVLPGLPAIDANGNADLTFKDGLLTSSVLKQVGITATDTIQKPLPVDASFSLIITRANGKFSGTFMHPLGVTPYQGIILQKGVNKKGFGFFKTKAPAVKDYLGQSGSVTLTPQ